jgi:hypothetical protein
MTIEVTAKTFEQSIEQGIVFIRMPTADEIVAGLTKISNQAVVVAVVWHVVLMAAVLAPCGGVAPRATDRAHPSRLAARVCCGPGVRVRQPV